MSTRIPEPLFVLEMANNHMGDVEHGVRLIRSLGEVVRKFDFRCAFKLQYRELESFIHPAMKGRDDIKYIKRFSETKLSKAEFQQLVDEMRANGFLIMATPFDEPSVDLIEAQNLDFIKIASCSFTDWPLLERVVCSDLPIIASTAGATLDDMDKVISFLVHRNKEFTILHCIGEYPTPDERINLSQIDFLKNRYPGIPIGFSTHENPDNFDIVKLAVAKGAVLFEKHVGLATDAYPLNAYSASPRQVEQWLEAARSAFTLCGVGNRRLESNPAETASLRSLRRGVFAKRQIRAGELLLLEDVYFAFPPEEGQITANDWSKYTHCTATTGIAANQAISCSNATLVDQQEQVLRIVRSVKEILNTSGITFPGRSELEISHHYGIERFWEAGLTMLTVVNRAYCKKLLILMAGQRHPEQYHKVKEETFHILYGTVQLRLDGVTQTYTPGDVITVDPGVRHAFTTAEGAIIEEISSTHHRNDSFYTDPAINVNRYRKTLISSWME